MFDRYVGVPGTARVIIDLGASRTVREIDSHWLSLTAMGVWAPSTVTVTVSADALTWRSVGTAGPAARPVDAGTWPRYVPVAQQSFSAVYTTGTLAVTARYLNLVATNPYGSADWTMTDSISVR